ncbi:MAG: glycosyltransferase [Pseudomonadota bacterium]
MDPATPQQYDDSAPWAVALFAHNVEATVVASLRSLLASAGDHPLVIHVLANGCRDRTEQRVRTFAAEQPAVRLHSIARADKADAWNHYVHELAPDVEAHIFADGDVTVSPEALEALTVSLEAEPHLAAVGAMPTSGRSREAWRRRMVRNGALAGGLYALRGTFLARIRAAGLRLPIGFIGEDQLVSLMVREDLGQAAGAPAQARLSFNHHAGFAFRSLSPLRPGDWLRYWRRRRRYRLRGYQMSLLIAWLQQKGWQALPDTVDQLYAWPERLPQLSWHGRETLFAWLALRQMARARRRAKRTEEARP